MRPLALTLILGLIGPVAAQDAPKAIIEKAIKAHGGADLLGKFTAERTTVKGTIAIMGMEVQMTATSVTQYPDKQKVVGTLTVQGQELKVVQVANGDSLTLSINGQQIPLPDEQKADNRQELYADSLLRLVMLVKGTDYTLKAGAEVAVEGNPAVSVVVEHAKFKPVTLSFDKESGRLVRMTFKVTDEGAEVEKVNTYADYKAVQGVQVAHKQVVTKDGKKEAEVTIEKVEMLEKVDASEFAVD